MNEMWLGPKKKKKKKKKIRSRNETAWAAKNAKMTNEIWRKPGNEFSMFFAYSIQNVFYWHQCKIILWMHIYIQSTIFIMRNRQGVDKNEEMVN